MKEFEVDVEYEMVKKVMATIKVKAKNKKAAANNIDKNMFEGKSFINNPELWIEKFEHGDQPIVTDVREAKK